MLMKKVLGKFFKTGTLNGFGEREGGARSVRLEAAFFRISSALCARGEVNGILEVIARESLTCLKANRSSVFCLDPSIENLKTLFTYFHDLQYQQVGLAEEKEIVQMALSQAKPLLLKDPDSISAIFKGERENKINSLMCIPLLVRGKHIGVLSAVLIKEKYNFDERDLGLFSCFANHASTAMELAELREETQRGDKIWNMYGQYLDSILGKLQRS